MATVLAHKLARLRPTAVPMQPSGDPQDRGRVMALAGALIGFGLFSANCAINSRCFRDPLSQGWKSSRLGAFSEREWVFALTVPFGPTGRDAYAVRGAVKPYLFSNLRTAIKSLRRRSALLAGIAGVIG